MDYTQKVSALVQLGDTLRKVESGHAVLERAMAYNPWFIIDFQLKAIHAWGELLREEQLRAWLNDYEGLEPVTPKTVALILAGNIPLVGLHDVLSVFITGHIGLIKPSSDDTILTEWIVNKLIVIDPQANDYFKFAGEKRLENFDAVIATGSNNSYRYFEYYFKSKPSLLRKNRNSVAILNGRENKAELEALADDVFTYFGLGCRSVSKLFVPEGYDFTSMFEAFEKYAWVIHHNKYANNYTYHKAIFLMNQTLHLDNGFLLVKIDDKTASPLGALFYETYSDLGSLQEKLKDQTEDIQVVVGVSAIPFGESQRPGLADYADGADTIAFLTGLQ